MTYNVTMHDQTDYSVLVQTLAAHFGARLKMMVLFGDRYPVGWFSTSG